MQLLILIIVISTCAVQLLDAKPSDNLVKGLQNQIENLLKKINIIRDNFNSKIQNINEINFDIRKQEIVAAVQNALDQKAGQTGTTECKKKFEQALLQLVATIRTLAVARLTSAVNDMDNLRSKLNQILPRLTGTALNDEIKACETSKAKCNLTGRYPTAIGVADNSLKLLDPLVNSKNLKIIVDENAATLTPQINKNIVEPIGACLTPGPDSNGGYHKRL